MSYSFILSRSMNKGRATAAFKQTEQKRLLRVEIDLLSQQRPRQHPVEELVEEEEEEPKQELNQRVVDIEPHADARGKVSDQRLDDAEHAKGLRTTNPAPSPMTAPNNRPGIGCRRISAK